MHLSPCYISLKNQLLVTSISYKVYMSHWWCQEWYFSQTTWSKRCSNQLISICVNPARDAGDTSPNILVGDVSGNIPPILLRTFGYSRLFVVTRWQHLMMCFSHCFARKSKICHRIARTPLRELTIKKKFKFSTSEFNKICHFETTKQKLPLLRFPPVGEEHLSPHSTPSGPSFPQLWTRIDATAY